MPSHAIRAEDRERDCLARRDRNAELVARPHRERIDGSAQGLEKRWILRAAAGDDELAPFHPGWGLAFERVGHRARGERDRGRERIV